MEQLKSMTDNLISCVQGQMSNLHNANSKELGEAIDMIKDLEEAIYYCTITKAMEKREEEEERYSSKHYYSYPPVYYNNDSMMSSGTRSRHYYSYPSYYDRMDAIDRERDSREGRSPMKRKYYMESKELHHTKEQQMKELEDYMSELSNDILEMIKEASPEEKMSLSQKLTTLAEKVK